MAQFETPILFLVFNRPDKTEITFNQLRNIKPLNLYIAADGHRSDRKDEKEKCEKVREIVKRIDWPCSPKFLFRENNLGCSKAVKSAIDWFFGEVELGIIIEDDCFPDLSFFPYCTELLQKYKNVDKIMMISGSNLNVKSGKYSYYFSRYGQIWGWATWKRAWAKYEVKLNSSARKIKFYSKKEEIFWNKNFTNIIWDVQWAVYSIWQNDGLSILPNTNLITNIGFGKDATNYLDENSNAANLKTESMCFPMKHPENISYILEKDEEIFNSFYYRSKFNIYLNALKNKLFL